MTNKKNILLKIDNIGLETKDKELILQNISFDIYKEDRISIVGPSGSGKSTLLRIINRLIEPTYGTIHFQNKNYKSLPPQELRRKIGLVLQTPFLFPGTIAKNIAFGPLQHNQTISETEIKDLLKEVGLDGYANRNVANISGGEAQRVSLARTLANKPDILLLDEPTSSLDKRSETLIEKLLCKIANDAHLTCIIVTHNQAQAKRLTNKSIVLQKGKIQKI